MLKIELVCSAIYFYSSNASVKLNFVQVMIYILLTLTFIFPLRLYQVISEIFTIGYYLTSKRSQVLCSA